MGTSSGFPWKDAAVPALINAVINGWIAFSQFSAKGMVALTEDSITSGSHSAFGTAVSTATALGLILSLINFGMERKHAPASDPPIPRGEVIGFAIKLGLKNAFFFLGIFVTLAVFWQRFMGSITVTPMVGAIVVAVIAAGVTGYLVHDARKAHRFFLAARAKGVSPD